MTIDFRLSQWFIVNVDSAFRSLTCVPVGSVADISEVHDPSIFKTKFTTLKMETAYTSETFTALPTSTQKKHSRV
jgi:hypothetical protein